MNRILFVYSADVFKEGKLDTNLFRQRGARQLNSAFFLLLAVLMSCAPPIRYNPGLELLKHHKFADPYQVPDSLRGVLKITVYEAGIKNTITGLISAVPLKKYKMEFMGPMGVGLGSFYWVKDSMWTFVNHRERSYQQGMVETIDFPFIRLNSSVVHGMLGFLWGHYLPEGKLEHLGTKSGKSTFMDSRNGEVYTVSTKSGLVESILFQDRFKVNFRDYYIYNERPMARFVEFYENEKLKLEFHLTKIEDNPSWKKSPFSIRIPEK